MDFIVHEQFQRKANEYKRPLKHTKAVPVRTVGIVEDAAAFQGLRAEGVGVPQLPLCMNVGDSVILDFGDHFVGYLHFSLNHYQTHITDSPVMFRFTFGEKPLEVITPAEKYKGTHTYGWLQEEIKTVVFTPYTGSLERRYAFRYLKIERVDGARFPVCFTDIFVDAVSAVDLGDVAPFDIPDPMLQRIYHMSLNTLKECEQDVFEDGPKRDRRLWIGDLRLQAMTDYVSFGNVDLIKRCIYLFAAYRTGGGFVPSCIFVDSPPYVDTWWFSDYSLFFISCLYDYARNVDDRAFVEEMYDTAEEQFRLVSATLDRENKRFQSNVMAHVDWCPGMDKSVAHLGVYVYTLKQLLWLAEYLGKPTADIAVAIDEASDMLRSYYDADRHLFVTASGQVSWQSQIFGVLSGVLTDEQNAAVLQAIEASDTPYTVRTPYMMHYYIDALWGLGQKERAMQKMKDYWSVFVHYGFDCCPELYNPDDHFMSPYFKASEADSMCHAWSCTPAYWIYRYYREA